MPWVKAILACVVLAIALQAQTAAAQGDLLDTDGLAEAIVAMTSRVWTGPRTPAPERVQRPGEASMAIRSPRALLTVHADPGVSWHTIGQAMRALEHARARLDAMGWPAPVSDGDLGRWAGSRSLPHGRPPRRCLFRWRRTVDVSRPSLDIRRTEPGDTRGQPRRVRDRSLRRTVVDEHGPSRSKNLAARNCGVVDMGAHRPLRV